MYNIFSCFYLQSALVVAIANIQIPLLLGKVVNVVANYTKDTTTEAARTFKDEIWVPSVKLVKIYFVQVMLIQTMSSNPTQFKSKNC